MMSQRRRFRVGGVPEHFNLPWHLAIEKETFQPENFRLEFIDFEGGTGQIMQALEDQTIDMALVLTEGCFAHQLNSPNIRMVKVYVETPLIWGIHVAGNSEIQQIEETHGCRYAISRFGSGSHLMALVDHQMRHWPIDRFQPVEVGGLDGARISLASGEADVFLWERYTTSQFVQTNEFRRLDDRKAPWPAFVAAVHIDTIISFERDIKTILAQIQQLATLLTQSNADAIQLIADRYRLELQQVKQWLQQTRWSSDFEIPWNGLNAIWNVFEQIGLNLLLSNSNSSNSAVYPTRQWTLPYDREFIRRSIWHQL